MSAIGKSILAKHARKPGITVNLADYIDLPEPQPATVRPLVSGEMRDSMMVAHAHVAEAAKGAGGGEAAFAADPAVIDSSKLLSSVWYAFRDESGEAIFPSPAWLREHLTPAEIGVLANVALEAEARARKDRAAMTREHVEGLIELAVRHWNDPMPEVALAHFDRTWVTTLALTAGFTWAQERARHVALIEQAAELLASTESAAAWRSSAAQALAEMKGSAT